MSEIELDKLKEPFPESIVSWRAQTLTKAGDKALALAYIDARDVMERLDDVCGPANWQVRYSQAESKTIAEIGIKIGGEWIWKANGAGDTQVEAEKGAISDAMKRAAVLWGIGRYLYDVKTPWVPCETYTDKSGKQRFSKFTANPWDIVRGAKPKTKPVEKNTPFTGEEFLGLKQEIEEATSKAKLDAAREKAIAQRSRMTEEQQRTIGKVIQDKLKEKERQSSIAQNAEKLLREPIQGMAQ
jgi:hypothetical protein